MSEEMQVTEAKQRVKLSNGKSFEVKELSFFELNELLKMLTKHAADLLKIENGVLVGFSFDKLPDLVAGSNDLSAFIVEKSTSMKKEEFEGLTLRDALKILDSAIAQTLNDDVIKSGKSIGDRLLTVMGGRKLGASVKLQTS